ncbi:tripartite ATP-independent transporter DctP family solute receptor [Caldalkalibacillus uzonensis]|uniref:Tripartite ATP-independent transporter DctP family solute receptor n=1 Tax=Caldalkalibacillus uzonensis TaxID=353224 RepID=A0ABU0CSN0_9BACI|nr:TRAP transporter substrate-binding protein [Caldalkalibacillus uzonensis]MDQ0338042.1 tripartite ATP-independent transporter DctP family solute receptor [Caldalkalibacillus uzonensis]
MKKLIWVSIVCVLITILSACGADNETSTTSEEPNNNDGSVETIQWKLAHLADENHIWHKTALKFADLVNEKTGGQIEITIFPNSVLGGETDVINSIKAGTVDLVISGETMANWAPKAALMAVPYAFRDEEHLKRVIEGEIGKEIEAEIKEKVGLTPLYYHQRAPRNLTSNDPINTPEDLKGFRMRVPNVPLFLSVWEAAGANPQVMDFNEVFTGLQQGVIDGQENPVDLIHSAGFYEVQKYVNETEHVYSWIYVLVGNEQFESLTEEQKQAVLAAAEEAQAYGQELFATETEGYISNLKDKGMIFNEVDQDAFREAMLPAIKQNLSDEQYELYERILEVE